MTGSHSRLGISDRESRTTGVIRAYDTGHATIVLNVASDIDLWVNQGLQRYFEGKSLRWSPAYQLRPCPRMGKRGLQAPLHLPPKHP